jgi:hypothetical protein
MENEKKPDNILDAINNAMKITGEIVDLKCDLGAMCWILEDVLNHTHEDDLDNLKNLIIIKDRLISKYNLRLTLDKYTAELNAKSATPGLLRLQ